MLGVLFGLIAGTKHGFIPSGCPTDTGAATAGRLEQERGFIEFDAALLGFQNEAALFVQVDESGAGETAGIAESYWPLEYVIVVATVRDGWIGTGDVEIVAQLRKEQLVIGSLGGGGVLPPLDEWVSWHQRGRGVLNASLTAGRSGSAGNQSGRVKRHCVG